MIYLTNTSLGFSCRHQSLVVKNHSLSRSRAGEHSAWQHLAGDCCRTLNWMACDFCNYQALAVWCTRSSVLGKQKGLEVKYSEKATETILNLASSTEDLDFNTCNHSWPTITTMTANKTTWQQQQRQRQRRQPQRQPQRQPKRQPQPQPQPQQQQQQQHQQQQQQRQQQRKRHMLQMEDYTSKRSIEERQHQCKCINAHSSKVIGKPAWRSTSANLSMLQPTFACPASVATQCHVSIIKAETTNCSEVPWVFHEPIQSLKT